MKNLNEELSVNNNVIAMTDEIEKELLQRIKSTKTSISKERNKLIKKGSFIYNTNGKLIIPSFTVNFVVYVYSNEKEYYRDYDFQLIDLGCECDYENNFILIRIATVNEIISRESYGSIEHEFNHMLQNSFGQKKNETLYKNVVNQVNNGTQLVKNIAYALYLSFNTEISSFAVQYYGYLKNNKIPLEDIQYDYPYDEINQYGDFLKYYNISVKNKDNVTNQQMVDAFGISKKEVFNRLENAKRQYNTKTMKVITKYNGELQEERKQGINTKTNLSQLNSVHRMTFILECYNNGVYQTESEYF